MSGPGYDGSVKRIGLCLLLASAFSCSNAPIDPPYVGCDPACGRGETCVRGFCIRTSLPPDPCAGGACSDAGADASRDASGG